MRDGAGVADTMTAEAGFWRPTLDVARIVGHGTFELFDEDGNLKLYGTFENLVTQVGDQYVGERATGIGSPPAQVTGMRLGTGTQAPAKTGTGFASIQTVGTGTANSKAIDGSFPTSSLSGASRRIQWKTSWAAGEATQNALAEVVITNETPLTQVAGTTANTLSRALLSPVVNKGASDTLAITWNWDILGGP